LARLRTDWARIERTLPHLRTAIMYGPPGTGKTTTAFAGRDRDEIVVMPCHEEMAVAEVLGHWIPAGHGRFGWYDGFALHAWKHGKRLVADEFDLVQGPVMSIFRAILNDESVARLTIPRPDMAGMTDAALVECLERGDGMVTLAPTEGFEVIATMNGDMSDLDEPLQERFDGAFYIGEPHPNAIKSLPAGLRVVARRTACETNPQRRISVRSWKKFAALAEKIGHEDAAFATFGERHAVMVDALRIGGLNLDTMFARRGAKPTTPATAARAAATAAEATAAAMTAEPERGGRRARIAAEATAATAEATATPGRGPRLAAAERAERRARIASAIEPLADEASRVRETLLKGQTRSELRAMAASMGLPQGPNKAALVRRLANRGVTVASSDGRIVVPVPGASS
jgi:DNA polymerase III delta prime subunit